MKKYIFLGLLVIIAAFSFRNLFLDIPNNVHYFTNGALFGASLVLIILIIIYGKRMKK